MLVAVFMLFVVGAMAALAIDVVTLYTARSEAQLAADAAALAAVRVLANSGMTSDPNDMMLASNAETLAQTVATQVAASNTVGGRNLIPGGPCAGGGEISVCFNNSAPTFGTNPHVTVRVQRTDLPTFFARMWGWKQIAVAASATAEAYNPSSTTAFGEPAIPVAPTCVKPWLLPNISPNTGATAPQIFDPATGVILDTNLLGWVTPPGGGSTAVRLRTDCALASGAPTNCDPSSTPPNPWKYYPATTDPSGDFPAPSASSVVCPSCTTAYELSVAGCVQTPISCNSTVHIDQAGDVTDLETATAVNGLTHSTFGGGGDSVDTAVWMPPFGNEPFQFLAGADNPVVQYGAPIMVSDSLVTVPVIDTSAWPPAGYPTVQIIGFVQLFLNPTGAASHSGHIRTQVINLAGCGTGATGTPILGNGASPVAVRLITPP